MQTCKCDDVDKIVNKVFDELIWKALMRLLWNFDWDFRWCFWIDVEWLNALKAKCCKHNWNRYRQTWLSASQKLNIARQLNITR